MLVHLKQLKIFDKQIFKLFSSYDINLRPRFFVIGKEQNRKTTSVMWIKGNQNDVLRNN